MITSIVDVKIQLDISSRGHHSRHNNLMALDLCRWTDMFDKTCLLWMKVHAGFLNMAQVTKGSREK